MAASAGHPEQRNSGDYAPAVGFQCRVVGQSGCAFELRALSFEWTHADLHAAALLGAYTGGEIGFGVGTPYWVLAHAAPDLAAVFRWDF